MLKDFSTGMITKIAAFSLFSASLFMFAALSYAQQVADPEFKVTVAHPAYSKNGPRVLFDEAHNNFHTTHGRYKPFADLLTEDGYYVVASRKPFTKESLATFKVMVIADALPRLTRRSFAGAIPRRVECFASRS